MISSHNDWTDEIASAIKRANAPLHRRITKLERELEKVRALARRKRVVQHIHTSADYNP